MQTYRELKRKQMLKQITEEEYQQGKASIIENIVKQLNYSKDSQKTK